MTTAEYLARAAIDDVVQRERAARDAGQWEEMAACYHHESHIDVSWFQGTGEAFVAASRKNAGQIALSFHTMGPAVITINHDRALADTGCALHEIAELDGGDVAIVCHMRLLWRIQRHTARWLIAGLHAIYLSDTMQPRSPGNAPQIDEALLATQRPSYKNLSYFFTRKGREFRNDLPGIDRPETVTAIREAEQTWLNRSNAITFNL